MAEYLAGATVYVLAERYGIHRATVGQHLAARDIDTQPPGLHPDDVPTTVELYQAGWSLARIATKFHTSDMTVRARLLEAGVVMRSPHKRVRL
ncbi:helix-turn-helix domain containing protein [Haloechinothrix salitolerans]|uniref:Helix-turn-helix domain containing protein n=1 Tax=Haloechinothrix salitolerans TaxID=926830 RepID=A0ABW2BYN5_9PSEU